MRSEWTNPGRGLWWTRILLPAFIALVAIVPYLGVLDSPFVFDDEKLVKENQFIRQGWGDWAHIAATFDITSRKWDEDELRLNYRPLRFLSYRIDNTISEAIFGPTPESGPPVFAFHLSNILLHAANSLLVLVMARRLGRWIYGDSGPDPDGAFSAFFAVSTALLFALHPIQTEAVTYVSGRRDVLSAFFFLSAMVIYMGSPCGKAPGWMSVISVPVLCALGLLTKESVATLPGAMILIDLVRRSRWGVRRALQLALCLALAGLSVWITLTNPRLVSFSDFGAPLNTALTACRYVVRYLALTIFPVRQSIDYSFDAIQPSTGLFSPQSTLPEALFVAGLVVTACWGLPRIRRRSEVSPFRKLWPLGVFWFLGTLLPVLQFIPIAEKFAERFAYLPALGIFLLLASVAVRLFQKEAMLAIGALALVGVAMLAATVRRNGDWETPLSLWTSAVDAQPRAARAHLGRANALKEAGRHREAVEEYSLALAIFEEKPDVPLHHGFILHALTFRGSITGLLSEQDPALLEEAISDYRRVLGLKDVDQVEIESSPKHVVLHFDLGGLLLRKGDRPAARKEYERVIEIVPGSPLAGAAHYYLATIFVASGDLEAGSASFRKALDAIPKGDPSRLRVVLEFADHLIERKSLDEAYKLVSEAIASGATGKLRLHLLMREAKVLDRKGDLKGCIATLERILAEDSTYGPALLTLGRIEASESKYDKAEGRYQALLKLEPSNAEALEGLQSVRLLRRIAEGNLGSKGTGDDPRPLLEAMERKGLEMMAKGEILAARDTFSKLLIRATEAKKLDFQTLCLRALAKLEETLGNHRTAEAHLKTALELDPRDARALRQLGDLVLRRFDDRAAARRYYEQCVEARPGGELADPLVYMNLAELIGASDPSLALSHLERARKSGYAEPALDRAFGYRHADAGHWKESLDAFNRYFERTPVFQEGGGVDRAREAAKDFVRDRVVPQVGE